MNSLQEEILLIYKEFKRICDENDLQYFAIGGTCIGSVRHKGFIPWDDDIDLGMPIDDYNRFRKLALKSLNPQFRLFDYSNVEHSEITFIKLFDTKTTFIENHLISFPDRYTGVFIDIMPISGLPNNFIFRKITAVKETIYCLLDRNIRLGYSFKKTKKGKFIYILSKPLFLFKDKFYFTKKLEELLVKYPFDKSKYVSFHWRGTKNGYKMIFPKAIFSEKLDVTFEDSVMPIPKDFDKYLSMDFGNYMQLPPKEKRKGGHSDSIVDLEHSYLDYVGAKIR